MTRIIGLCRLMLAAFSLSIASDAFAQPQRDARLLVTVVDPSKAAIPGATVTVSGLDETTKAAVAPVQTSEQGVAAFGGLQPGRYAVQAAFPGFQTGTLKDIRMRAGDNKHVIVLAIEGLQDSVSVKRDAQEAAADRRGSAFGTALTREQVEALSGDPDEMAQQLQDMAGGNAVHDSHRSGRQRRSTGKIDVGLNFNF